MIVTTQHEDDYMVYVTETDTSQPPIRIEGNFYKFNSEVVQRIPKQLKRNKNEK